MVTAANLDRKITIQRASTVMNEFNEPVETWADLVTVRAMRRDVSDGEKFASDQIGSHLAARFTVRSSTGTRGIKASDRLVHEGANWNIIGVKETADGRHRFLEITATRDAD